MFNDILNYILSLGAAIFLPIIMILLGLCVKMKVKKAIMSGLTLGIAFTGMNVILGFMFDTISPAAQALVTNTGLQLTAIDVGWSPIAAISWAWPFALFMFPVQIIINGIMLALRLTNVLNVDLWNVWGKIFVAAIVSYMSGSIILGFAAAIVQIILELKNADVTAKQLQHITKIPGVTCSHPLVIEAVTCNIINKILDFIPGLNKINMDANKLKKKLGIFGENSVMGFIVGGLIAFIGGYDVKGILTTAMEVATALILFPMVAKLFMQALAPIADAIGDYMKNKFKDREFYIGLDWPFLAGQSEIWVTAILLVPINLALAVIMSYFNLNNTIPLASIINIAVAVPALIITNGNLIRMIIISTIITPIYLAVATSFAPILSSMATSTGILAVPAGQFITLVGIDAPEVRWILANAFNGNIIGIILLIAFLAAFIWYYKGMQLKNKQLENK